MKRTGLNNKLRKIHEDNKTIYFRRRLSDIKRLVRYAKNNTDNITDFINYLQSVLTHMNNGGDNYDIIKTIDFIFKHLKDDINDVYNKSNDLNESREELRYRRHIKEIDEIILSGISIVSNEYNTQSFCSTFKSPRELIFTIIEEVSSIIYYRYFSEIDDESEEWGDVYELNYNYIKNIFGDEITLMWNRRCRSRN